MKTAENDCWDLAILKNKLLIYLTMTFDILETKICTFSFKSKHFIFNKCPIYIHDSASAKFSTNLQEKTDYSVS
jgi:hypothetical protein